MALSSQLLTKPLSPDIIQNASPHKTKMTAAMNSIVETSLLIMSFFYV